VDVSRRRHGRRAAAAGKAAAPESTASAVLALQRSAGNDATQRLLRAPAKPKPAPKPPIYSAEDAQKVADRWKNEGALVTSETKEEIETVAYTRWRERLRAAIDQIVVDAIRGKGRTLELEGIAEPISVIEQDLAGWSAWVAEFEAHERFVLRNPGGAAKPGAPPDPGPPPGELVAAKDPAGKDVGAPPSPSFRIVRKHTVTIPGRTEPITYTEAVRKGGVSPDYKYLTNETGLGRMGTPLIKRTDMNDLFDAAGITDVAQRKALVKVPAKEGGFEAVNTYDTGFVSVGAIQFTTREAGTGSLIDVLRAAKLANEDEFATYFRDLGIDVDDQGLGVVDPGSASVLRGKDAVRKIMDDPRLTAVFQHAGERWRTYQVAQLKEAIRSYWLADQAVKVKYTLGRKKPKAIELDGRFSDVLRSEAGKIALMDTAVQKGAPTAKKLFREACAAVGKKHEVMSLDELALYEREIIPAIVNRIPVLKETDLTQPPPLPLKSVKPFGPGDFPTPVSASGTPV
jgi:hypothetical protein